MTKVSAPKKASNSIKPIMINSGDSDTTKFFPLSFPRIPTAILSAMAHKTSKAEDTNSTKDSTLIE